MKLKVLVDNNTYIDEYYCGEPAVSYYIEDEGTKLLFDTGYSDLFLKNAAAFGIDLSEIDVIAISHGHDDHTRGLKFFFEYFDRQDVTLVAHPDAFKEKTIGEHKICSPILQNELAQKCKLDLSKEPVQLSEHITFLGEIPQYNGFEVREPIGVQSERQDAREEIEEEIEEEVREDFVQVTITDDYVMDDTALVYHDQNGIFVITGCSHSGICNIIEHAKMICGDNRVLGVIGGFHLFETSVRVDKTIAYLKNNGVKELYPCHCTSFAVKAEIHKQLPVVEVGVGMEIQR